MASLSVVRSMGVGVAGGVDGADLFIIRLQQELGRVSGCAGRPFALGRPEGFMQQRRWSGMHWAARPGHVPSVLNGTHMPGNWPCQGGLRSLSAKAASLHTLRPIANDRSSNCPCNHRATALQVASFAESKAAALRGSLRSLQQRSAALGRQDPGALRAEAKALGDEVLDLERYVHLNQVG